MKKALTIFVSFLFAVSSCIAAYSDVTIANYPGESFSWTAASYETANRYGAIISDTPYTDRILEVVVDTSVNVSAGSYHASDPKVTIDLGFTVVSPAVDYAGTKVAEGSVRLSDGSWAEIGYDQFLDGGYYRLLREEVDTTGTAWYVVAAHASNLGDYYTPDGSVATELWLKKSDCTATGVMSLNTDNETRQLIVKTALSLLGKQYQYGSSGPESFDCSGFVSYCLTSSGISGLPRTSTELCSVGTEVGIGGLLPGDIVGRSGHVGIYIGDGLFVHSSQTVTGVICESVSDYNRSNPFTNYRSVVS